MAEFVFSTFFKQTRPSMRPKATDDKYAEVNALGNLSIACGTFMAIKGQQLVLNNVFFFHSREVRLDLTMQSKFVVDLRSALLDLQSKSLLYLRFQSKLIRRLSDAQNKKNLFPYCHKNQPI